jgi:pimeloyl-ACP methyl ester carboxylesterase
MLALRQNGFRTPLNALAPIKKEHSMSTLTDTRQTIDQPTRTQRRRGYGFYLKRGLLALIALLVALPVLGFSYEMIMAASDATRHPPPGRLVIVDGHQMHLNCSGTGGTTVVMDSGLGGWSLDWDAVQPSIAQFTRVCSYDRAGLGWSEPGAAPGDGQHAVDELHTLLANGGESGPFVLVGHSNGGLRVALYAHTYPQEVAGLVLVDPTPRSTDSERVGFLSPADQAEFLTLVQAMKPEPEGGANIFEWLRKLRPFGIPRLLTNMLLEGSSYDYVRADQQPGYRAGMNKRGRLATTIAETEQREANMERVRAVGSLGSLPLTVLTSTKFTTFYRDPLPAEPSGRLMELLQKMLWESEVDMSRLSSNSTITPIERSGHFIQFDRPDAVIQAVQHMVETVSGR